MTRMLLAFGIFMALVGDQATPARAKDAHCAVRINGHAPTEDGGPGEVVIGAHDGRLEIIRAAGLAHLELPVKIRPGSVVRIASLTKQFTAVAVLTLVEDGLVSLDSSLKTYLPDAPPHWRGITLRQLLSHTSGLTSDMTPVLRHMTDDMAPGELVSLFAGMPLSAVPGTAWRYSNLNYWILGLVIEKATHKSYADYVQERVLRPAKLVRTRYGHHRAIIPGRTAGYEIDRAGCIHNARYFSSSLGYAAGGFISTPLEMSKWYEALSQGRIVTPATIELALTPVKTRDRVSTAYGLGWYVDEIGGRKVGHHGGSSIGYSAYVYWSPSSHIFAGVFRNWSDEAGEPKKSARDMYVQLTRRR